MTWHTSHMRTFWAKVDVADSTGCCNNARARRRRAEKKLEVVAA